MRATREPIALSWAWPGVTPAVVPDRRFELDPRWLEEAAARSGYVTRGDRSRALTWVEGFFAAAGQREREDLLASKGAGDPSWSPYGEEPVDAVLRWWARLERAARRRRRALAEVEADAVVVSPIPARARRRALSQAVSERAVGGAVALPEKKKQSRLPHQIATKPDDAFLDRVDAALSKIDEFNVRFAERLRKFESRRGVVADDDSVA